ncbi:protein of unknown function [Taphrina deformans PYCC 5710]|uniref:Jacalin-type lectin domain-containing protein n=1 Tax=Taphrina deformans (strain PYCC 5710 / ATCC 11124 / CBS 356.35 / IMI 108563 / JCM 9778 / NBRC 8474) TaxID=1097556 RepID=R4XL28_TAPDE|nr:protein of unknown function [Taphrina deformans PYCC 5710]|eukprot:CCG84019.1 protein of unknown function [Taphrina deformans PYCC 5710]
MIIPTRDRIPCITSILPSTTVHTRLLLVCGEVPHTAEGEVQITPHRRHIPTQKVAVRNNIFKALIPLCPGDNEIELLYYCRESRRPYSSLFYCTYIPLLQNPPLKLVIIVGSDSPGIYDDAPNAKHAPTLETAIKKLRFAGYMWAAYTALEMAAAGFDQRTFRLDEAWLPDSISNQCSSYTQTANIQVLRAKYTTAEIRDPDKAQQNKGAGAAGGLFDIALQTLSANPATNGPKEYVAAMFLDAHFDPTSGLITGHAALGGGTAQHSLAIFGSHSLFSWPTCLEELEDCLTDTRPVDRRHCGVDGEGRLYFAACTVGMGAMMHEVGHLFGCPHQESGVMLRDYPRIHRSLTALDPASADQVVGAGTCHWHRLDLLRFLSHPSFALPLDAAVVRDDSFSVLPSPAGLSITSRGTIAVIEYYSTGHEFPRGRVEVHDTHVFLPTAALRDVDRVLVLGTCPDLAVPDIKSLLTPLLIHGRTVWRSVTFGSRPGRPLCAVHVGSGVRHIEVFSGACLDGLVLHYRDPDGGQQVFGNRGGQRRVFELSEGEELVGLVVRSGEWVDGVQFLTNRQRSEFYGNRHGGSEHVVNCPPGHRICGFFGEVDAWVNKIGVLYLES